MHCQPAETSECQLIPFHASLKARRLTGADDVEHDEGEASCESPAVQPVALRAAWQRERLVAQRALVGLRL